MSVLASMWPAARAGIAAAMTAMTTAMRRMRTKRRPLKWPGLADDA
jgi:hypothetical protein